MRFVATRKTLLRKMRRDREITLGLLSQKTGVNISTISRAERGLITPSDEVRAKLARYFRVAADVLFAEAA